ILTAYSIVQEYVAKEKLETCKKKIQLFYNNHANNVWEEKDISSLKDVMGDKLENSDYIQMVRAILKKLRGVKEYYPNYLYLCKAMTRARYVARDEFGIEVDDGERKNIFSINNDRAKRARLAEYTVKFILEAAEELKKFQYGPWIESLSKVVRLCNDTFKVRMSQKGNWLPLLPIYSSEKVALAKACMEGWPIILRLSRVNYKENTQ